MSANPEAATPEAGTPTIVLVHRDSMRFMAERAGAPTVDIDASHAVAVSRPGPVTDLIDTAARATTR